MYISVPLENHELFAEVKDGKLISLREPSIPDYNEHPEKCLYFIQRIVEAIKSQKEIEPENKGGS